MKYWHFLPEDGRLRYGSNELVKPLHTYILPPETKIIPCSVGFHASTRAIDALQYAPGPLVSLCTLHGEIVSHGDPLDKYAAHGRTHLWIADATDTLRAFSRWCALSVIDKWNAPQVVIDYLNTGNESLRAAAGAAARDAARAAAQVTALVAARDAARVAAQVTALVAARDAARVAAQDAARDAAQDAARAAAQDAAWTTAWTAARAAQNTQLEKMLMELAQK